MFHNLENEMSSRNITRQEVATVLGVRKATVIDKLKGRYEFTLAEAMKIQSHFFPKKTIDYLFQKTRHR